MANFERSEQQYLRNSAILSTKLFDNRGNVLEIIDCVPKFIAHDRNYNPFMLIRKLTAVKGRPRVQIRLRPTFGYGWGTPEKTRGSNHIRYLLSNMTTRLTTNAPISYIIDEVLFEVEDPLYLVLMPDESLKATIQEMCETYLEKTLTWWRNWVKTLTIPLEWQEEVIRAAIALRMAQFEETGAIVSAMTTSIPHSPKGGNYDYRYCWLRDTFWIVDTLNLIGATSTMEAYLKFLNNIVAEFAENPSGIQPVFGISLEKRIKEREMHRLPGYHGIGPVKIGNKDAETVQNDVYGSIILSLYTTFVDKRLGNQGDEILFRRMEGVGEMAVNSYNQPDHGPQGMSTAIHTYSSVMCWAACDRLAKIAQLLKLDDRNKFWKDAANRIHEDIMKHAWNGKMNSFVSTWDSEDIDHYLMFLPQLKFISASDPKFVSTFELVEKKLLRNGLLICRNPGDSVASVAGTFQYINTLSRMGREGDARQKFEKMLKFMVHKGMVSESIDPTTNQLWGNFPQNKAIVGLITCAIKLSKSWEEAF